ncbi:MULTISPECIES: SMP-30/gluconolactonase/LRE family protein [unclassified Leptolyngbya]|uniref:SMP-30/gluconolactonase/LRE family protein n=1 Tax=unclassified Leptolyngbya TaxID=2650499 RepID=UPI001684FD05|nr:MULTISPECIES: SMP-30/gluconolactonase/LRE family protein [unclassified Leptolyngbya]MBD1909076.1 SMP-30/gluconolactonase/LRE family protein [Leptolyngbya sp. FACHB-8]MBD2159024.1 SMP-30/gluconolactonase/LRE family protein [Leptolyngbya sp. FACHB-16]
MNLAVQNVLSARARLGECPVWDGDRQCLYWVDAYNYRVHQFEPATGNSRYFDTGDVVSAIALTGHDRLLIALRDRLAFLSLSTGEVSTLKPIEFPFPNTRCNDGKCDSKGRFWIGTVSEEKGQAELYRYDPNGSLTVMETGLTISNGLGWSPDESTFYLTDSAQHKIYAYDFEVETGEIRDRRVLVDLSNEAVEPDGLAIDVQGNLWSALWDGGCVACFDPTGQELLRVKMPVPRPTCPIFGGSHLTDLYVTSASIGFGQKEIQQHHTSGDLFCIPTQTSGMPTHSFQ